MSDEYNSVPPNRTFTVPTRYTYMGKGNPRPYLMENEMTQDEEIKLLRGFAKEIMEDWPDSCSVEGREAMTYSKWQSGTIAPQLSGGYERRDIGGGELLSCHYDLATKKWILLVSNVYSRYQAHNGHLWQWRGKL